MTAIEMRSHPGHSGEGGGRAWAELCPVHGAPHRHHRILCWEALTLFGVGVKDKQRVSDDLTSALLGGTSSTDSHTTRSYP